MKLFLYLEIADHLMHFTIIGRMVAKVILMDNMNCDINFTKSFLKLILDKKLAISDIDDLDKEFG